MIEPQFSFAQAMDKIKWAANIRVRLDIAIDQKLGDGRSLLVLNPNEAGTAVTLACTEPQEWPVEIPLLFNDYCQTLRTALDFCYAGVARSIAKSVDRKMSMPIGDEKYITESVEREFCGKIASVMKDLLINRVGPKSEEKVFYISSLRDLQDICDAQKNQTLLPRLGTFYIFSGTKLRCCVTQKELTVPSGNLLDPSEGTIIFQSRDAELIWGGMSSIGIVWQDAATLGPAYNHNMMRDLIDGVWRVIQHFCEVWQSADNPNFEIINAEIAHSVQFSREIAAQYVEAAKMQQAEKVEAVVPKPTLDGPLEDIFKQINDCLNNGQTYLAIMTALAIPDICATLATKRGGVGPRYINWVKATLGSDVCGLTPDHLWSLRNGMFHEGKMGNNIEIMGRVVFMIKNPNLQFSVAMNNCEVGGLKYNKANIVYAQDFCEKLTTAARKWLIKNQSNVQVQDNIKHLVKVWPNGYEPLVVGVECVA